MATQLNYNINKSFKIVQFTDLHWENGHGNDMLTKRLMEQVLDEEKPDLAVITGDLIESTACLDPKASIEQIAEVVEATGTPWAAVFGNHDTEAGISRSEFSDLLLGFDHCLSEAGPLELSGSGNFMLRIADSQGNLDKALFFLDSGSYSNHRIGGYAPIARDQIEWYTKQSAAMSQENGGPVPALAFFHIPLPEYNDVWDLETCYGSKFESVCCAKVNTGMFAAMVEMGDVMGTFVGHDHVNSYWGELHGIRLCYGRQTGYNNYSRKGFKRGARVICLEEGKPGFQTWIRLEGGEVLLEKEGHLPEKKLEKSTASF
ncbi:metallophosphoesterase family protein [Paenibacillus caui]|uniref:metallophosphoesterase family protein n=1 Tax=Paenibacillus caui TaxID=2873927 RepID=UPI001CA9C28F|nr:metallophosphoesterase family protein [Paenibacillus caui]